jgi:hypothetical protein
MKQLVHRARFDPRRQPEAIPPGVMQTIDDATAFFGIRPVNVSVVFEYMSYRAMWNTISLEDKSLLAQAQGHVPGAGPARHAVRCQAAVVYRRGARVRHDADDGDVHAAQHEGEVVQGGAVLPGQLVGGGPCELLYARMAAVCLRGTPIVSDPPMHFPLLLALLDPSTQVFDKTKADAKKLGI